MISIKEDFLSNQVVLNFLSNDENFHQIQLAAELLVSCINSGGKILSCGNGGSMCDAMHFFKSFQVFLIKKENLFLQFVFPILHI